MKTRILSIFAGLAIGIIGIAPAFADTFNFAFAGQANGSGTFTANPTATAGQFLITGITGTINGFTITSLLAPGSYPVMATPANDNRLFFPAAPIPPDHVPGFFDLAGVSFVANGTNFNAFFDGQNNFVLSGPGEALSNLDTFSVTRASTVTGGNSTVTPEPESMLLVGTGLLAGVGMLRRRFARV